MGRYILKTQTVTVFILSWTDPLIHQLHNMVSEDMKQWLLQPSVKRSEKITILLPAHLTNTSYSVWLANKQTAAATSQLQDDLQHHNICLAETKEKRVPDIVTDVRQDIMERSSASLAEQVRTGLLIAGGEVNQTDVKEEMSPSVSLADQVRRGLLKAGTMQDDTFFVSREADSEKVEVTGGDEINPTTSFAEQVRAGLLQAGSSLYSKKTEHPPSSDSSERWKTEFAIHLSKIAKEEDWIITDDNDDDESIITLDTVTDTESSMDLEQFDVLEEVNDEMMMWLARN